MTTQIRSLTRRRNAGDLLLFSASAAWARIRLENATILPEPGYLESLAYTVAFSISTVAISLYFTAATGR